MTLSLTVEQVLDYHERLAGGGPVRDLDIVTAAVMRPQLGFGGHEAHRTLPEKAAALLHGLASTQGFEDGNKRTAWIATVAFLELNGLEVPDMPVIDAEVLVAAVAVSAWTERTVGKAAEWLEAHITASTAAVVAWLRENDEIIGRLQEGVLAATTAAGDAGRALESGVGEAVVDKALARVAVLSEAQLAVIAQASTLPPIPDPETARHFGLALARWGDAAEDLREAARRSDAGMTERAAAALGAGTNEFLQTAAALRRVTGQPAAPRNPYS